MPSPDDHNPIESQLADLRPRLAAPAPEAFLAGVRARRTRTIVTRSALGVGALGLLAALTIRLAAPSGPGSTTGPGPLPLAGGADSPNPAAPDLTHSPPRDRTRLASFRKLYTEDQSIDSLLDGLPTVPGHAGEPGTLRLGDRDARWTEGL